MVDGHELKQKRGAVTVLALLVSLLLGYAPAAAQASPDRSASLGPTELVKRGQALRTSVRAEADDADPELASAEPPKVRTELAWLRPAGSSYPLVDTGEPRRAPLAYRARAPPLS